MIIIDDFRNEGDTKNEVDFKNEEDLIRITLKCRRSKNQGNLKMKMTQKRRRT